MTFAPRRAVKSKLGERTLVQGVLADSPSDDLVACLAPLGFDLIFIDCEHGGTDFETVMRMTRAARAGGVAKLLRPWSKEPGLLRRFIDSGVDGIVAPGVETAAEAQLLTQIIAASEPLDPESILFMPLIESRLGVENLDAILAVPGVDGLMIAASDLAVAGRAASRRGAAGARNGVPGPGPRARLGGRLGYRRRAAAPKRLWMGAPPS
ncbi:aldolase/citrate lyase family protein [Phenylobacterium sp.]|uniref:aldolase/citrate lyase family protein n=1 Tax=Phenylobacterium sp. TaxID=1871053 RepID=UPI002BA85C73|nr:aldolase/citrate lyase family protein [Phenylobacterium sp.]HLZ77110.1 aldolase/citrate lyase family protein [Phenylobacterium sp.]